MKKYQLELEVVANQFLNNNHFKLILRNVDDCAPMPKMAPGQFVQIRVKDSPNTFLRRPISICYADGRELWLMIQAKGEGTSRLANLQVGDMVDLLLPLGNGFTMPKEGEKVLLVGGGVGVAPLYFLGKEMKKKDMEPVFLLGARTASLLLDIDEFRKLGEVFVTTEDGSEGEKGFVTQHSLLQARHFDKICTCGPKPMMVSVARYARQAETECEVSLENMMACGLGACLCCVEKTVKGNVCVCTEGPVFNINQLTWQI